MRPWLAELLWFLAVSAAVLLIFFSAYSIARRHWPTEPQVEHESWNYLEGE